MKQKQWEEQYFNSFKNDPKGRISMSKIDRLVNSKNLTDKIMRKTKI
jgi:hypothetical protein